MRDPLETLALGRGLLIFPSHLATRRREVLLPLQISWRSQVRAVKIDRDVIDNWFPFKYK